MKDAIEFSPRLKMILSLNDGSDVSVDKPTEMTFQDDRKKFNELRFLLYIGKKIKCALCNL